LLQSNGGAVGRPHGARALIARGVVQDFPEAFTRYLGTAGSAFVARERLSIEDAISVAHEAGALAIWAHPGDGGRRERLEPLVAAGVRGGKDGGPGRGGGSTGWRSSIPAIPRKMSSGCRRSPISSGSYRAV